jgi:hypothetical protein
MNGGIINSSRSAWIVIGLLMSCNSISHDEVRRNKFYTYASDELGCSAEPATAEQLVVNDHGKQWVIIAPVRVVSTGRDRRYAGLPGVPIDVEIAKPLELALHKRIGELPSAGTNVDLNSSITRIKIVSLWHGVLGLGMGTAVGQIAVRFNICVNGDLPESKVPNEVARNGPKMNTLWYQPRGEELRSDLRTAADEAISAVVEYAFRFRE